MIINSTNINLMLTELTQYKRDHNTNQCLLGTGTKMQQYYARGFIFR